MKLTFKKTPPETGLSGVARPGHRETIVKADGLQCGYIALNWAGNSWLVRVAVRRPPTEENPAPFKWVKFKTEFNDEPAARIWIEKHWSKIEDLGLYRFTDA